MKRLLFLLIPAFAALALHAQDNAQKNDLYEIMSHNMANIIICFFSNLSVFFTIFAF